MRDILDTPRSPPLISSIAFELKEERKFAPDFEVLDASSITIRETNGRLERSMAHNGFSSLAAQAAMYVQVPSYSRLVSKIAARVEGWAGASRHRQVTVVISKLLPLAVTFRTERSIMHCTRQVGSNLNPAELSNYSFQEHACGLMNRTSRSFLLA